MSQQAIDREREYWDKRYINQGPSGYRYKEIIKKEWAIIDKHLPDLGAVLDVGCGDLRFWEGNWGKTYSYIGLDISKEIIEKNRTKHWDASKLSFITAPAEDYMPSLKADTVFCLNTLFHIMNESNFYKILDNLCKYAKKCLVLSTWVSNPFIEGDTDGEYQKYTFFDRKYVISRGFKNLGSYKFISIAKEQVLISKNKRVRNMKDRSEKGFFIFQRI
jgi:2-polyprenyl-3-methyl-5-hydroxy-6-metoxy-1,4-benzoquinol methylase